MADFQAPPTYAEVVIIDDRTKKATFNPIWLKWFLDVAQFISASGGGGGGGVTHNNLDGLQGGTANEYYHLSAANYTALLAGNFTNVTASGQIRGATARFGTYTAAAVPQTGYIDILDSGGVARRLLVG